MSEFAAAESVVFDVIGGRASYLDGLRAVVAYQQKWNENLSRYWKSEGFEARSVERPEEVPPVPVDLFRRLRLVSDELEVTQVFRTSGTTTGLRGVHHRFATRAYDLGARRHFRACVPEFSVAPLAVHFVPDPRTTPDSSLSHMVEDLSVHVDAVSPRYVLGARGLDVEALDVAREAASNRPVLMFGTAFAFAHWLERGGSWRLPAGSVVIETGGFKGRGIAWSRRDYVEILRERLGADAAYFSEYSMTELSSQGYAPLGAAIEEQAFVFPNWCRVFACDPETLRVLPSGEEGILRFVDLANVETVVSVQTSDVGIVREDGVTLLGRSAGAVPRGCSLAAAELLNE